MKFRRWAVVGFLAALMVFSFVHLSSAGSKYRVLTTSDSGYFYGIAREIDGSDGYVERYDLSRPPQGLPVPKSNQLQPLMLVMMYRGVHSINPGVSMMDVCQYFSPLIFILALIGIFLAARELGGDLAGAGAAFFLSVMFGSIYWTKLGAFDREITQIFFGAWCAYLFIKLFKAPRRSMLKYGVLAGLVYGLFVISWAGALYLAPILIGGLILVVLNRIPAKKERGVSVEGAIYIGIRENLRLIAGVALTIGVVTVVATSLGGYAPDFWVGFSKRIGGFIGIGGEEGVPFTSVVASEEVPPSDYLIGLQHHTYAGGNPGAPPGSHSRGLWESGSLLANITLALLCVGVLKVIWTRRRGELLLIPWLLVVGLMATNQSRFFRLWWPMLPIMAGFGLAASIQFIQYVLTRPEFSTSGWTDRLRQPTTIALAACIFMTPFIQNARANATDTSPSPHGGTAGITYLSLIDAYEWIRDNTPENSVVAVEWSYGHLLTGIAERQSVVDGAGGLAREEGVWKDENLPFSPPDYIYFVSGGKKYRYGHDALNRPYKIDGRRPDMQGRGSHSLYNTSDENEFSWMIKAYRDNYNCKIDYIVFNFVREDSALNSNISNVREFKRSSITGEGLIVYQSENENVIYYGGSAAYLQKNGTFAPVRVIFYDVSRRRFTGWSAFDPREYAYNALLIRHSRGEIIRDNRGVPEAMLSDQAIPMLTRARFKYEMPGYLVESYRSRPYGLTAVCRIIHENVPPE